MASHEGKPVAPLVADRNNAPHVPSRGYILGIRAFEISSSLAIIICLAVAAAAHNTLYDEGINYDSSRFRTNQHNVSSPNQTGYDDTSGVLYWMTLGLVISCVGFAYSLLSCFDRQFRIPLLQALISFVLCAGFVVYVVYGAINTPYEFKCYGLDEEEWIKNKQAGYSTILTAQNNRCAAPKAAEFFAFVATFSYAFSACVGIKVWLDRKRYPEVPVV
ncbi:18004_t:CDS:1 [Acaulospora morrowiae]|uniref:18004_t:CDS:1 n=1 Tax=Acaulospora morrowiae TaxID=94023 RepID=A0A9N8W2T7_9GLOM|nr:18004_t:CDS:1 [Acaulospora morrowiae]